MWFVKVFWMVCVVREGFLDGSRALEGFGRFF